MYCNGSNKSGENRPTQWSKCVSVRRSWGPNPHTFRRADGEGSFPSFCSSGWCHHGGDNGNAPWFLWLFRSWANRGHHKPLEPRPIVLRTICELSHQLWSCRSGWPQKAFGQVTLRRRCIHGVWWIRSRRIHVWRKWSRKHFEVHENKLQRNKWEGLILLNLVWKSFVFSCVTKLSNSILLQWRLCVKSCRCRSGTLCCLCVNIAFCVFQLWPFLPCGSENSFLLVSLVCFCFCRHDSIVHVLRVWAPLALWKQQNLHSRLCLTRQCAEA